MKKIREMLSLAGVVETITVTQLREQPGEVLDQVELGKRFNITRNDKVCAVLVQAEAFDWGALQKLRKASKY